MYDSNGENRIEVTTRNFEFSEVLNRFRTIWKQILILFSPSTTAFKEIGSFITISGINDFRGYSYQISFNLILIGMLNLLPLPGFNMGNFIISVLETLRKKSYNKKRKRIIGWITMFLVIVILVVII